VLTKGKIVSKCDYCQLTRYCDNLLPSMLISVASRVKLAQLHKKIKFGPVMQHNREQFTNEPVGRASLSPAKQLPVEEE
jgi:hypothetical protein